MRAIACGLVLSLFPALVLAETIEFTLDGSIVEQAAQGSPTFWNNPGPEPTNYQITFDVNTLAPANSVNYTFGPTSLGPSIDSINANLVTTNVVVSLDGKVVYQSPTGTFGFSGTNQLGEFGFIGGGAGLDDINSVVGLGFGPNFGLGETLQSQLTGASDPLGLILNGSSFNNDPDDLSVLTYLDSRLGASVNGGGSAISVPEPAPLILFGLAGLVLALVHRRRLAGGTRDRALMGPAF
jgi:hypothetical protein